MNYLSSMQPLDKDTLFSIFEQGDEQVYKEHGIEETLKNPFVLMGMVLNGLENFQMMDMMYKRNYPEKYKEVKNTIQLKYYTRLYGYLTRIPKEPFNDIYKIGESFESGDCYAALDHLRIYFERLEQYEKCGTIRQYMDLLIDNYPVKVASLI